MDLYTVLSEASISPATSSEASHTVASDAAQGVLLVTVTGADGDLRFSMTGTATATSPPLQDGVLVPLRAEKGDTVSIFNTTGAGRTAYILEVA